MSVDIKKTHQNKSCIIKGCFFVQSPKISNPVSSFNRNHWYKAEYKVMHHWQYWIYKLIGINKKKHLCRMMSYSAKWKSAFVAANKSRRALWADLQQIWSSVNNLWMKGSKLLLLSSFCCLLCLLLSPTSSSFLFFPLPVCWFLLQANKVRWSQIRASLCIGLVPSVFSICPLSAALH